RCSRASSRASASTRMRFCATQAMTRLRSAGSGPPGRWREAACFSPSALEPGRDDEYRDHADDDSKGDGPSADADSPGGLAHRLIVRDLLIALPVLLVGRAHRPVPRSWSACGRGLECSIN